MAYPKGYVPEGSLTLNYQRVRYLSPMNFASSQPTTSLQVIPALQVREEKLKAAMTEARDDGLEPGMRKSWRKM